ncbi:MAG: hypothetical protein CFE21_05935 [Bacteroidetes bacterium B1(2017)]|nr:MAG: hypothetical protein CFE21_05935 [Bacteroidetes bacterium B1(2017)]
MKLEDLTLEILAERALSQFDSKKLVDWAVKVLELGNECENLYVLAGLDYNTTEERENYFWKCVVDLNLIIEKNEEVLIEKYALMIANKAIRNEVSLKYAISQLGEIVRASKYDPRYSAFYEIDEYIDYLTYDSLVKFNKELAIENSEDYILDELKNFLKMEELKIPVEERNKCYCERCKKLNTPKIKNKYQLKRPFKSTVWSCEFCGSEKIKFHTNQEVKSRIIEEFKKNTSNSSLG